MRRSLAALALVTALTVPFVTGCDDSSFDTRSCVFVNPPQSGTPCDPDDVVGSVLGKTAGSSDGGNPSVRVSTRQGEVRVFMKPKFWATYHVGEAYP